jgi:PEGA domain.
MRFMRHTVLILLTAVLAMGVYGAAAAEIGGESGYYHITSAPSGAAVYFDGTYKGTTPITLEVSTTGTPGHTLSLSLPGYQAYTQTIPGNPSAGQTVYITATLTPLAGSGKGYYQVSSSPTNAEVYFDGIFKGTSPVTVEVSSTGTPGHTINVYKSGYQSFSQYYAGNPQDGQTIYVYASLTPVQSYGSVYVTSSPQGATATLDDSRTGTTPYTFTSVPVGSHSVTVSLPGYQTYTGTVLVTSGSAPTVSVTLPQITGTGSLYVTSTPVGARLSVDGDYYGTTPTTAGSLSQGTHQVLLSLTGYQDYSGTVSIATGQTTYLTPTLVKVAPTTSYGTLSISSTPTDAEAYVDNVFRGYTPLTLNDIPPGSHTITLRLDGYQNWQGTVQVNAGQTTTVQGILGPVPTTTSTKLPGFGTAVVMAALGILGAAVCRRRD